MNEQTIYNLLQCLNYSTNIAQKKTTYEDTLTNNFVLS